MRMSSLAMLGSIGFLLAGCGGGGGGSLGGEDIRVRATGTGSYESAKQACRSLGINIISERPGSIINGELPEAGPSGTVHVNIVVEGGTVEVRFYNAPENAAWTNRWRNKILNSIATAGRK